MALGADVRSRPDNQPPDKHVESRFVTCLDGGSSPPSSTEEEVRRDLFLFPHPRKNVIKHESNPCKEEGDAALQIHFLVALFVSAIHFLVALSVSAIHLLVALYYLQRCLGFVQWTITNHYVLQDKQLQKFTKLWATNL